MDKKRISANNIANRIMETLENGKAKTNRDLVVEK